MYHHGLASLMSDAIITVCKEHLSGGAPCPGITGNRVRFPPPN